MKMTERIIHKTEIPGLDDIVKELQLYASLLGTTIPFDPCTITLNHKDEGYHGERLIELPDSPFNIKEEGLWPSKTRIKFGDVVYDFSYRAGKNAPIDESESTKEGLAGQEIQKMQFKTMLSPLGYDSKFTVDGVVTLYFEDNEFGQQVRLGALKRPSYFEHLGPSNLVGLEEYTEQLHEIGNGFVQEGYNDFLMGIQRDFVPEKTIVVASFDREIECDGVDINALSIYLRLRRLHKNVPGGLENVEQALKFVLEAKEVTDVWDGYAKKRVIIGDQELEMRVQTYDFLTSEKGQKTINALRKLYDKQKAVYSNLKESVHAAL